MLRKILFGTVALLGLTLLGTSTADAGWRRAYRQGYYAPYGYNGGYYYAPRRAYRQSYYPQGGYYYGSPGYYAPPVYYYGSGYNYGPIYNYGPGVGFQTRNFGFYVRLSDDAFPFNPAAAHPV